MKYYPIRGAILHGSGGTDSNSNASTLHHTADDINRWHKIRFGDDCLSSLSMWGGYHFFIDQYGKTTQFRKDDEEGCHCKFFNRGYMGICLAGNFDIEHPTDAQTASLKVLWKELVKKYPQLLGTLRPHRNFAFKSCPGNLISNDWIRIIDDSAAKTPEDTQVVVDAHLQERRLMQKTLNGIMAILASLLNQVERRVNKK